MRSDVPRERLQDIVTNTWRGIRGLGNVLRHEYDAVDDSTIKRIVENALGPLRQACVNELG